MAKEKREAIKASTGEGRLINNSLFEKDVFTDDKGREATPSYKVELAFDNDEPLGDLIDAIYAAVEKEWGADAAAEYDDGGIEDPIKDGSELAANRRAKGKNGDAYDGKLVIRAHTVFNRNGEDAPGGVYVCGPDAQELDFASRGTIFNGCRGLVNVTVSPYTISGRRGITLYLNGFQKTGEGERLRGSDPSGLFSPMMAKGSEGKGRKARGK